MNLQCAVPEYRTVHGTGYSCTPAVHQPRCIIWALLLTHRIDGKLHPCTEFPYPRTVLHMYSNTRDGSLDAARAWAALHARMLSCPRAGAYVATDAGCVTDLNLLERTRTGRKHDV